MNAGTLIETDSYGFEFVQITGTDGTRHLIRDTSTTFELIRDAEGYARQLGDAAFHQAEPAVTDGIRDSYADTLEDLEPHLLQVHLDALTDWLHELTGMHAVHMGASCNVCENRASDTSEINLALGQNIPLTILGI